MPQVIDINELVMKSGREANGQSALVVVKRARRRKVLALIREDVLRVLSLGNSFHSLARLADSLRDHSLVSCVPSDGLGE